MDARSPAKFLAAGLAVALSVANAFSQKATVSDLDGWTRQVDPMGRLQAWPAEERPLAAVLYCIDSIQTHAKATLQNHSSRGEHARYWLSTTLAEIVQLYDLAKMVRDRFELELPAGMERQMGEIRQAISPIFVANGEDGRPNPEISESEQIAILQALSSPVKAGGNSKR